MDDNTLFVLLYVPGEFNGWKIYGTTVMVGYPEDFHEVWADGNPSYIRQIDRSEMPPELLPVLVDLYVH
jgi:hypothetical protein